MEFTDIQSSSHTLQGVATWGETHVVGVSPRTRLPSSLHSGCLSSPYRGWPRGTRPTWWGQAPRPDYMKSRPPGGCSSELPGEEGHSLSPPPLCWPMWPQTQLAQRSSIQLHWLKKETSLKALNCITFHSVINHLSTACM